MLCTVKAGDRKERKMFDIGELIMYGTNGVCRVEGFTHSPFDTHDEREYYVLNPVHDQSNLVIYTPVENENVVMRRLLSFEKARSFLDGIADISAITVENERSRRDVYREALKTADPVNYVRIVKAVRRRREEFSRTRRRLPDMDIDFEHSAYSCLLGELSEVLGISRDEVDEKISEMLGKKVRMA